MAKKYQITLTGLRDRLTLAEIRELAKQVKKVATQFGTAEVSRFNLSRRFPWWLKYPSYGPCPSWT